MAARVRVRASRAHIAGLRHMERGQPVTFPPG